MLGVDANYFFSGIDEELSRQSPRNLILSDNLPQVESENPIKSDIMQDTDFIRMARAYERIQNTQAGEYVRGLFSAFPNIIGNLPSRHKSGKMFWPRAMRVIWVSIEVARFSLPVLIMPRTWSPLD